MRHLKFWSVASVTVLSMLALAGCDDLRAFGMFGADPDRAHDHRPGFAAHGRHDRNGLPLDQLRGDRHVADHVVRHRRRAAARHDAECIGRVLGHADRRWHVQLHGHREQRRSAWTATRIRT